ncbi:MAG: hypothetical protein QM706_03585 [Nitrospira sp.]
MQTPLHATQGTAPQSNTRTNTQPSAVRGHDATGKEQVVASLMLDVQTQLSHLSVLEEKAQQELALSGDDYLSFFPPPLNTSAFAAIRVAHLKEFLELDETTRTSFINFYGQIEDLNNTISLRDAASHTVRESSDKRIMVHDQSILEAIYLARDAVKTLKRY